jgi:putative ABC transport system permease protein
MWTKLAWLGVPRAWINGSHIAILQNETRLFDNFAAMRTTEMQLTGAGDAKQVRVGLTTPNLLDVLGVQPLTGRGFRPEEALEGNDKVAILGHALWQQHFGADPAVIGRQIMVDSYAVQIVGVMPPGFRFQVHSSLGDPMEPDLWSPGTWKFAELTQGYSFALLARVRQGVTLDQARAEIDAIGARLDRERFSNRGFGWQLLGVHEDMVKQARPALFVLAGAAVMVLLIVCANLASLFLVRGAGRDREFAIRLALGSSRGRVILQLLTESMLLALSGGAVGFGLAFVCVRAMAAAGNLGIPRLYDVAVDARVFAFTLGISVVTGVAFGLAPAFRYLRSKNTESLKDGGRGSAGRPTQRWRASLVTAEIALALVLLAGAGLLLRTFSALREVDPGFRSSGVVTARLSLSTAKYPDGAATIPFVRQLISRLEAERPVEAVGAANAIPLSRSTNQVGVRPPEKPAEQNLLVDAIRVTPGYFKAMGIQLKSGRDFAWSEGDQTEPVAVVDDISARQLWPGEDPVGKFLLAQYDNPVRVIGVVRQPRLYEVQRDDRPQVFLSILQSPARSLNVVVRSSQAESFPPMFRQVMRELDPNQPIASLRLMDEIVAQSMADRRLSMLLIATYAAFALLLAGLGIYGVIAYAVGQRAREIGIRIALGARVTDVLRMIVVQGMRLTMVGVGIGLAASFVLTRSLTNQLYGISATDPLTFVAVSIVLIGVALLASYVPARRVTRIHPSAALRSE